MAMRPMMKQAEGEEPAADAGTSFICIAPGQANAPGGDEDDGQGKDKQH